MRERSYRVKRAMTGLPAARQHALDRRWSRRQVLYFWMFDHNADLVAIVLLIVLALGCFIRFGRR